MHNSSVKCSRVIYFFPDVGLPGVRCRNIFSSNNPNDSQIACLSLVKNLLMMRVKGAPCLLVAHDSPVYEEKQKEKIIMFPPNHSRSWNLTTPEHLNKPSPPLSISHTSFLLHFWSAKSTFITITIKFPFSNSICTYVQTGISLGKKIGHDRYMSGSTGVLVLLLLQCNMKATVPFHFRFHVIIRTKWQEAGCLLSGA